MKKFFFYWFPLLAYASFIFYVSGKSISGVEGFRHMDKFIHCGEFALFNLLAYRAFGYGSSNSVLSQKAIALGILVSIIYAMSDEYHQSFVPERMASWGDALADFVGIGLSSVMLHFWRSKRHNS